MFLSRLRLTINEVKKVANSTIIEHDILRVTIQAGNGGQGLSRYNGVGGNGGDVFVMPRRKMAFNQLFNAFYNKKRQVFAENGASSTQITLVGKHGSHEIINVPLGSECIDETTRKLICRCINPNQKIRIAKGGIGGCAANGYKGEKGERFVMGIHMKLHPNIGLVGFPNAGKSTLLKALAPSMRKIKIAPYPFTTTKPQLLDVSFDELSHDQMEEKFTLSCADLPGLIEGAAMNRGKGHAFLKHLEYSDMLVMVVDAHGFQLSTNMKDAYRTPLETIALLNKELEAYDAKLVKKPCVLVLNKTDLPDGEKKAQEVADIVKDEWSKQLPSEFVPKRPITFRAVIQASAKNKEIGSLKPVLYQLYEELHPATTLSLESEFEDKSGSILF